MHEVLVNRLEGLSLSRKIVVRLTDRPDMTLDVYRGRKTTIQQQLSRTYFHGSKSVRAIEYLMYKQAEADILYGTNSGMHLHSRI